MKRLLTLTLALVMSLSLTACGGSDRRPERRAARRSG